jgi:hypothetical protein
MVVMVSPKNRENHLKHLITKNFVAGETSVQPAMQLADKLWTTLAHRWGVETVHSLCPHHTRLAPRGRG